MRLQRVVGPTGAPPEDLVRSELERILGSPSFQQASRASRLLRFLVERTLSGHPAEKEYTVGVEVFDKGTQYDPRSDASVRVEIARLRTRLHTYYDAEGQADQVLIQIPKGTYTALFESRAEAPLPKRSLWELRGKLLLAVVAVAAAIAAAWPVVARLEAPPRSALAVLPFTNLNGDAESEYLAEGFADELTATLGRQPKLQVAARTSAFRFKGTREDVRRIAEQLHVGAVLESSILRTGGRLKVTAQLIDGRSGYHIWAETLEREQAEASALLDEISQGVLKALQISSPTVPRRAAAPEVEELYWQGIYLRSRQDEQSRTRGVQSLEQAVLMDPGYAPAQSALALIYAGRFYHGALPHAEWVERAKVAAQKALAADETSPKAHAASGWVLWFYDRDWPAAEQELRRALELNPSYAGAHNLYALALTTRGRFPEALAEVNRARELDPLTYLVSTDLGLVAECARHYGQAKESARAALKLDAGFLPGHLLLGTCLSAEGQQDEAIQELRHVTGDDAGPEPVGRLGYALAKAGDRPAALAAAGRIEQMGVQGDSYLSLAMIYTGLGDKDRALEYLGKAVDDRDASAMYAGVDPAFDSLRSDARFQALRARLRLAP